MLNIKPISAFNDNYIWCLYDTETKEALLVDPGDANAALSFLNAEKLKLSHILITHHHPDHIGGVNKLKQHFACKTVGFSQANYQGVDIALSECSSIALLSITFKIIEVPGHTLDHIAFYAAKQGAIDTPLLFCGDTLFSAGCGRLFEGTPAQMLNSLDKFKLLPEATLIYCAHEYTLANLNFVTALLPNNSDVAAYRTLCENKRAQGHATIPTTLGNECRINPFLGSERHEIATAAQAFTGTLETDPLSVFAAIRKAKDSF